MTDLRHFIRSYDGVLAPAVCERIIRLFEGAAPHHTGPRGRPVGERDQRNFNWVQMSTASLAAFGELDRHVAERVTEHAGRYVADTGYTLFPYGFEEFLIKRYSGAATEQFPAHVDVTFTGTMHRMLAVLLYLNDVEQGGETFFGLLDLAIRPRRGRLVMFPPVWMYPHAGLPPATGVKYILGTYLTYVDLPQRKAG